MDDSAMGEKRLLEMEHQGSPGGAAEEEGGGGHRSVPNWRPIRPPGRSVVTYSGVAPVTQIERTVAARATGRHRWEGSILCRLLLTCTDSYLCSVRMCLSILEEEGNGGCLSILEEEDNGATPSLHFFF
ncbi:hypothetical protein ZWY2020_042089 [Hordeum vulgare]|nr:hypothetical protein ZWY2020_042089 [Hordeum vulgare]